MNKHYTVHEMTVHGGNEHYEEFCYAYKTGNEFKLIKNGQAQIELLYNGSHRNHSQSRGIWI